MNLAPNPAGCPHCGPNVTGTYRKLGEERLRCPRCLRPLDALNASKGIPLLPLLVVLPLRTRNPLNGGFGNTRVAGILKQRRRAEERAVTRMAMTSALNRRGNPMSDWLPAIVTLTRVSVAQMDTDGLAASNKGIRDGIADALGVDDGARGGIEWRYEQRKGKRGVFAVEVLIERRPKP